MTLYDYDDYRPYLNDVCDTSAERGVRASLARAAECQASYLSQVLKGRAHLTEDQLMGITVSLGLVKSETEYLLMLLRYQKAGTPKLREYLKGLIHSAREESIHLARQVNADKVVRDEQHLGVYFNSWIPSTVHLLTSSPEFQTAEAIAERLHIPLKKTKETLKFLEHVGFIEYADKKWVYKRGSIHITKDSPLQSSMQFSRRELAARSIAINSEDSIHFSSVFTIDEKDLEEIRKMYRKAIEKSHKMISSSGTEKLACICLDVFEVV